MIHVQREMIVATEITTEDRTAQTEEMTVGTVVSSVIEITTEIMTETVTEDRTAATEITTEDKTAATEITIEEMIAEIVVRADSLETEDRIEKIMHLLFRHRKHQHRSLREATKAKEKMTIRRGITAMKMMSGC